MTLLADAKQAILAAMYDQTRPGVCVVSGSRNLDRVRLIVEVVDEYVGVPNQREVYFRSLFVSRDKPRLERLQKGLRTRRRGNGTMRRLREYNYETRQQTVAEPCELSFIDMYLLRELAPRFPPDCLELLVLDELQMGEMVRLLPFIDRTQPLFTLLVMTQEPPADSPWRERFGEPLVIRGPAQTPPLERPPAEEPAQDAN